MGRVPARGGNTDGLTLPPNRKTPSQEGLPLEHVAGDRCIHEDLLGLTFRISPHAFFQVAPNLGGS